MLGVTPPDSDWDWASDTTGASNHRTPATIAVGIFNNEDCIREFRFVTFRLVIFRTVIFTTTSTDYLTD
jgi:hypothetical protein